MKGEEQAAFLTSLFDLSYAIGLVILQRVLSASVTVNGQFVSSIGKGVLVLAAIAPDDTKKEVDRMAEKVLKYKLWPSAERDQVRRLCLDKQSKRQNPYWLLMCLRSPCLQFSGNNQSQT